MSNAQASAASDAPLPELVERTQIDSLASAAGPDTARAVVDAFWSSTDDLLDKLRAAAAEHRQEDAMRAAHAVKGSASNVGAARVAERARRIEAEARGGDADAAEIERLAEDYAATRAAFEEILSTLS